MDYLYLAIGFILGFVACILVEAFKNRDAKPKIRASKSRIIRPKTLAGKVAHYINSIDEQDYRNCRLRIGVPDLEYVVIRPQENDHVPFRDIMRDTAAKQEEITALLAKNAGAYPVKLELIYEVAGQRYAVSDSVDPHDLTAAEVFEKILTLADDLAVSIKRKIPK